MNRLKFSYNCRCASVAMVSKTIDDLPEPDTPVKIVIFRLGIRSDTSFRLFSRAPRISMNSFMRASTVSAYGKAKLYTVRRPHRPGAHLRPREQRAAVAPSTGRCQDCVTCEDP